MRLITPSSGIQSTASSRGSGNGSRPSLADQHSVTALLQYSPEQLVAKTIAALSETGSADPAMYSRVLQILSLSAQSSEPHINPDVQMQTPIPTVHAQAASPPISIQPPAPAVSDQVSVSAASSGTFSINLSSHALHNLVKTGVLEAIKEQHLSCSAGVHRNGSAQTSSTEQPTKTMKRREPKKYPGTKLLFDVRMLLLFRSLVFQPTTFHSADSEIIYGEKRSHRRPIILFRSRSMLQFFSRTNATEIPRLTQTGWFWLGIIHSRIVGTRARLVFWRTVS